jgi:hypothetical protein
MNFIKKIVDGEKNESIHLLFKKFSKGEFKDRALIFAKRTAKNISIKTSAEFANELVKDCGEKLGEEKTNVTGAIVTTSDLTDELEFKEKKQFQGVKRYMIDAEMSGNEIVSLVEKFSKAFFGLSFTGANFKLKIKAKAPKTGKPGSKKNDDPIIPDFCRLVTEDLKFGESFIFEKQDFKIANINHTFFIDEIIVPEELKKSEDFAKIRELAKRKGRILREGEIDGQKISKEIAFEA